ncbi:MAG TPA: hypothetical protein VLU73_02765 [Methylococcaceae bacterium]|nr:hypothetical protein [Methylococcaceae bacterium]
MANFSPLSFDERHSMSAFMSFVVSRRRAVPNFAAADSRVLDVYTGGSSTRTEAAWRIRLLSRPSGLAVAFALRRYHAIRLKGRDRASEKAQSLKYRGKD